MADHGNVPLKTFNLTNNIQEIDPRDSIFIHDVDENKRINAAQPWKTDPHYFKSCKISAVALIKMVIHARSGGVYEIMGLMQGRVQGTSLIIMDSFALPVQGTETRVNAGNEAIEYMSQYISGSEKAGRLENVIGWYHSHPGYGCWLSGIDVGTQSTNQKFQDPFVAVVIDPNRTISAGKVEIGAFRTYPEGYKPPNSTSDYQSIPLEKIEDFGVHADSYYPLEVSIFKSKLDEELLGQLWNKYWVNTLSQSPLVSNRAYAVNQLRDLSAKLAKAQPTLGRTTVASTAASLLHGMPSEGPGKRDPERSIAVGAAPMTPGKGKTPAASGAGGPGSEKENDKEKKEEGPLDQVMRDSTRISSEAQHGLIAQVLKDIIFSTRPNPSSSEEDTTMTAPLDAVISTSVPTL